MSADLGVTTSAPATAGTSRSGGPGTPVTGDGTTARSRLRARLLPWRWPAAGLGAVLLAGAVLLTLSDPESTLRLSPENPSATGGMALAQVLGDQGVEVVSTTSIAEAVAAASPGDTLLVATDYGMPDDVARSLLETGADVVLVAPGPALLAAATSEVTHAGTAPVAATQTVAAACTDPDATAAGEITRTGAGFRLTDEATSAVLCFADPADASAPGHYAVLDLASEVAPDLAAGAAGPTLRLLDEAGPLLNASVTDAGNAALGLRMLGHTERLVWLVPERPAPIDEAGGIGGMLPPWATALGVQLLVVAAVAMVWRGRRMGPLATENLPVVVQASETTTGRGRLYRRSRAHGHAGAALRARSADRMAVRLGVPRSSGSAAVVEAIARASGRPAEQVGALLYGPPPSGDVELTRLATDLDQLESEVHRP